MPNSATLVQALGAAFCTILCACFTPLSGMGGGGMMCASRIGAWAKSGGPTPQEYGGLKFTAEAANSSVQLTAVGSAPVVTLIKSFDGVNWSEYTVGDVISLPSVGDFVYLAAGEGGNRYFGRATGDCYRFVMTGLVAATGDIESIREFSLTHTAMTQGCYRGLFRDCTSLTSIPEIEVGASSTYSHQNMFRGCTGIVGVIKIQMEKISSVNCCYYMFYGCSGITGVEIETEEASSTSTNAMSSMFRNCSNLSSIKVHFKKWGSNKGNWVDGVSEHGTFYKPSELSEEYGTDKIPTGWTVVNID